MQRLWQEYHEKDTEVILVYCREAHSGGRYPEPATYEERLARAREFRQRLGSPYTIVVGPMDNSLHRAYGDLPNMAYVIDKRGLIVYRANWTRPPEIAEALESLWQREQQRARGMKLQPVYSERVTYRTPEENLNLEEVSIEVLEAETGNTDYMTESFGEEYAQAVRKRVQERKTPAR